MRAWIKQRNQYGLKKVEKEIPEIKENEVLVKVLATGICGTDFGIYKGYREVPENLVPGHEFCGEIIEKGERVKRYNVGDRVVPSIIVKCGTCRACLEGHEAQCENLCEIGIHIDGSFAEYVAVPENALHKVPNDIKADLGASIEPVAVAYSAVKKLNGFIPGSSVIIFGPGVIGLYITQIVIMAGASKVIVVGAASESEKRLSLARSYGAYTIKNSAENEEQIRRYLPNGKADYIFEATGAVEIMRNVTKYITPHGEIVLVSIYKDEAKVNLLDIVRNESQIKGSFCYTLAEFEDAIGLVTQKKMNFNGLIDKFSFDDLAEGFESAISKKSIKVILEP